MHADLTRGSLTLVVLLSVLKKAGLKGKWQEWGWVQVLGKPWHLLQLTLPTYIRVASRLAVTEIMF